MKFDVLRCKGGGGLFQQCRRGRLLDPFVMGMSSGRIGSLHTSAVS
jgi:hypothetical protein